MQRKLIHSIKIINIVFFQQIIELNGGNHQGRSQELEMGGAKLLGEGSRGCLRPPVGPGQSPGRGAKPPGSSRVFNI